MSKPSLLVLAAGLGSRFGGIKQMAPVGFNGEFVIDYSVYDAWRAGFGEVVFVIRPELEAPLREHFEANLEGRMGLKFVCQQMNDLPGNYQCPETRIKPWGTGHAVWCARNAINGTFAAINADDFYGATSYSVLEKFLRKEEDAPLPVAMVGYKLRNTLSEFGSVSRGVCQVGPDHLLTDITERGNIQFVNGKLGSWNADLTDCHPLTGEEPVSLNFWGFSKTLFPHLERLFLDFLSENINEPKKEFYLPAAVDNLVKNGKCVSEVLDTPEHWFGMTYAADKQAVTEKIAALTADGIYPKNLWQR